ncbi:hypothetical protein ACS0TY_002023 [Phlomoides rotata]
MANSVINPRLVNLDSKANFNRSRKETPQLRNLGVNSNWYAINCPLLAVLSMTQTKFIFI